MDGDDLRVSCFIGFRFGKLECVNPDGHIFTRFCGRIFGDFRGVHSMLSMRAFGMCVRESLKDESCVRESRKKGRVGTCANARRGP